MLYPIVVYLLSNAASLTPGIFLSYVCLPPIFHIILEYISHMIYH